MTSIDSRPLVPSLLLLATLSRAALADDTNPDYIPEAVPGAAEGTATGWTPFLATGGNVSFLDNHNVVGAADGATFTGSLVLDGRLTYLGPNKHTEWVNSLGWILSYTRTPTVPVFVKSGDALQLQSTYLHHFTKTPWIGPFGDFRLTTAVFPGHVVSATDAVLLPIEVDGTQLDPIAIGSLENHQLTRAFAPTTLRESVGAFFLPVDQVKLRVETRAGLGAWESFVQEGFYVADDAATATIEIQRMQDSVQLGAEVNVKATGAISEQLSYSASAALMAPFIYNVETDLAGTQLLNHEYTAGLSVKLASWAALQYQFSAVRTPLVIDAWQVQNGLLLSFSANVVGGKK